MTIRWLLAALHLLALGIGLGAVWARSRAFRAPLDPAGVRRVLSSDSWWGLSALLWISTGVIRAFAGFEKGTSYYIHNKLFLIKMGLLLLILLLELGPMLTLIRWRIALAKGQTVDTRSAPRFALISSIQTVLIVLMVLAATGMARGFGAIVQN
jgi:putative membrane protein